MSLFDLGAGARLRQLFPVSGGGPLHASGISGRRKSGELSPALLAGLFTGGYIGDVWRFSPPYSDAVADNDPIGSVTGAVNGRALTASSTARPLLRKVGNRWCARTDGVNDRLVHNFGSAVAQPGTIIVCLGDSSIATHTIATGSSTGSRWQISNDGSGNVIAFAGTTLDSTLNEPPADPAKVLMAEFDGATTKFYANGVLVATGNAGTQSTDQITFGALWDGTFGGDINFYSALFINKKLSVAERQLAERVMASHGNVVL